MKLLRDSRRSSARSWIALAAAAAAATTLAGCGGGGGGSPTLYSSFTTRDCIAHTPGLTIVSGRAQLNYLVQKTADAFGTDVDGAFVTVAFTNTTDQARQLKSAYRKWAKVSAVPLADILSQQRNVVLLWTRKPSDAQRQLLDSCLKAD